MKSSKILLLIFVLLSIDLFAYSKTKDILLVQSYHRGYKWSDDISKVFEKKFGNNEDYSLTTVYMDTKKVNNYIYFERLYDLYLEQFKGRKFDIIVAVDNNALDFIMRYHEHLFRDLPVVFLGINNFDESMLYENNMRFYSTGVAENVDIKKNIDLILKIHPKLKKIVIINDRTKTGFAIRRDIFSVLPSYKNKVKFEYIDNIGIENLKKKISHLPKDTVILWVLLFKDKTGKYFTYKESLKQVKDITKVPIYGLWDFYLGKGIVGGLLTSATSQAKAAAKMVVQIFDGKKPADIPILVKSPNKYMFDYNELKKYKIKIPGDIKNYEVINKPFSFYEHYKYMVWVTISIFLIITSISILLAFNMIRRKKIEIALGNQLKFISVLMDTIPNPMNYKSLDGTYLGCNKAFSDLFGKEKEDIIGKNVYDFFEEDWAREQTKKDKELLDKKGTDNFEKTLHFPDGSSKTMTYSKTAYENIDGTLGGIVSIMDDITQRNQQKQFIIQQTKLAEMGEMIAAIAHQWNEPLVELSAILQDMEFSYGQDEMDTEKMKSFVKESMIQIQYMSSTLKDFRNFLKPSTKKVIFCARKALDEVLEIVGRQIFYAHIDLRVTCKEDYVPVYGYENEFKQVLLNIINNAKNKIINNKIGKSIYIDISAKEDYVKIKISDDGGPIPERIMNLIFDPYFSTDENGTGLGLYMAKVIVEDKMNGKIFAYNYTNKAVFSIIVSRKDVAKEEL
ncbi:MAG: ABC transporter substrate binding protein [Sulfurospirillaceae bacterium]|nr:ABC transporter substrate binding protein [Sulfurospirillaceae bacterium]